MSYDLAARSSYSFSRPDNNFEFDAAMKRHGVARAALPRRQIGVGREKCV
jgi:hypothetical protein